VTRLPCAAGAAAVGRQVGLARARASARHRARPRRPSPAPCPPWPDSPGLAQRASPGTAGTRTSPGRHPGGRAPSNRHASKPPSTLATAISHT